MAQFTSANVVPSGTAHTLYNYVYSLCRKAVHVFKISCVFLIETVLGVLESSVRFYLKVLLTFI